MKKIFIATAMLFAVLLFGNTPANAQKNRTIGIIKSALKGIEYEAKAGFVLGGTAPLPLPAEIRSIDTYNPTLSFSVEGNVVKWFGKKKKLGLNIGIRLENKNMTTKATVKNYGMEIFGNDGNKVKGNWTGGVKTKVRNSCFTIPVLAAWKINNRWNLKLGPYVSFLISKEFSGEVYEGYIRQGDPTGDKVYFRDGAVASYDFSNKLRSTQCGIQFGADWRAFKHLKVFADLTWGLSDIFKSNFETINFPMYPIYANIGFGYAF